MAIVRNNGYVQLRRGLFEHVKEGRLTFFEASLYVAMLSDANPSTGVCFGSAGLYAALYGVSDRTCRDALERLEAKHYLRRFATRGKHGSYPIIINKFLCSDGAMKGKYVSADRTSDYANIVYESRDEHVNDDVNENGDGRVDDSAASIEKREERRKTKTTSPSSFVLPDGIDVDLWDGWVEMRKKIRNAPFTDKARKGILEDLAKLKSLGKDPNARLAEAIKRGWRSVLFDSDKPFIAPSNADRSPETFAHPSRVISLDTIRLPKAGVQ